MTPFLFMTLELIDHWRNVELEVNDPGNHSVSITRKVLPTAYFMHKALVVFYYKFDLYIL